MPARTFEDSVGTVWEVFEVRRTREAPYGVSADLELGWLAFVSSTTKRRLAPIPTEWGAMSGGELEGLCALAREAPRIVATDEMGAFTPSLGQPLRDTVRSFAIAARARGTPVITALVQLKIVLADREAALSPSERAAPPDVRQVRRWFVDAYYFGDSPSTPIA